MIPDSEHLPVQSCSHLADVLIGLGPAVTEELPDVAHFLDHVEIQLSHDQFVLITTSFLDDLSTRVTEVTLPVELTDVPRCFVPDPVDGSGFDWLQLKLTMDAVVM